MEEYTGESRQKGSVQELKYIQLKHSGRGMCTDLNGLWKRFLADLKYKKKRLH